MAGAQGKKNIDMERVYCALDSGTPLQELLQGLGMKYRTLYRRHKAYQEGVPEGERRDALVKYKSAGKKCVDVPMEWVYAQLEAGRHLGDIAEELHVGARTVYSRHKEYREAHPGRGGVPETLRSRKGRGGRPKKEVDMEGIYGKLMGGASIREVCRGCGVSYPTLLARHREYQQVHQGGDARYARSRLSDFKGGGTQA